MIGKHQDRLGALFSQAGPAVDAKERHQLIAILHKIAAVGYFDAAAIDFLKASDQG